ncbi:Thioesterase/thiol ester dehydrase-isomerase [Backusella circina FSU 941]|nr:Thioesterase/thiol ester dehydrase-isomerase [Backusella circina FSU 941]
MPVVKFNTKRGEIEKVHPDENVDRGVATANAIKVDKVGTDLFMSREIWLPWGFRGAFGGQFIAQSLYAGFQTVPEDFFVHSLHCYFILSITGEVPVVYSVKRVRDGRSYATRTITATQNGKSAFVLSCSFARPDESLHVEHQTKMPDRVDPEKLPSDVEMMQTRLERTDYPEDIRKTLEEYNYAILPIEFRETSNYTGEEIATGDLKFNPHDGRWFRANGNPGDDLRIHACLIAYAADYELLNTASKANGTTYRSARVGMLSSLDHSMWFHEPTRADQWLLHDMYSPRSKGGRAVSFGRIYNRKGEVIATTAQEGVLRLSKKEQERRKKQAQSENDIKTKYGENNRL